MASNIDITPKPGSPVHNLAEAYRSARTGLATTAMQLDDESCAHEDFNHIHGDRISCQSCGREWVRSEINESSIKLIMVADDLATHVLNEGL